MGVETEYAVTAFGRDGTGCAPALVEHFIPVARQQFPHVLDRYVPTKGTHDCLLPLGQLSPKTQN